MRRALLAGLLLLAAAPAIGQAPARPRLIVAIAVDQLSADLFAQYRQHFTGGLRRLSQGVVFPAGYQSQAATETCPGHATILTGARPGRAGIIANNWFDQGAGRADKYIYCAEDERVPGSTSENYTVSAAHLRVPTLGDLMRRADPRSRVVAVSGKDRAAAMMGGHNPNQRWWWAGRAFVSHAGAAAPAPVTAANARIAEAIARPREAMALPGICESRSRAVAVAGGRATPVGTGRFARPADDRNAFRASPDFDRAIVGLAEAMRGEMRLGEGQAVDLLAIGLSASDYIGHSYGAGGSEMCIQLLALDRILGDFFQALDRADIDYAVMLTADHGGLDLPERTREQAGGGARVDPALGATRMGEALGRRLGLSGRVLLGDGPFGDMWVDNALPAPARRRVLASALAAYRAHPQVAAAFTRAELAATPSPSGPPDSWTLIQRARASFDAVRSGDIYVALKPGITPISDTSRGYVATHGSPWDYDRRVPILFWRRGMSGFEQPLAVETVDIMPTLAALIALPLAPGSVDGRCLDLVAGPETSCP